MTPLVLDQVVKRFGDFTAVDDLSFSVPESGVFGFLGGNGAGKTTSVRMMLDILRPDSGHLEILGRAQPRQRAADRLPAGRARPLSPDDGQRHRDLFRPPQGHDHRRCRPQRHCANRATGP